MTENDIYLFRWWDYYEIWDEEEVSYVWLMRRFSGTFKNLDLKVKKHHLNSIKKKSFSGGFNGLFMYVLMYVCIFVFVYLCMYISYLCM